MSVVSNRPMALTEFLDWEKRQPIRYEFDGFHPVAMTGGTVAHAQIQRNLAISVGGRLLGKRCSFYGSDLKIEVAGRIRYPDGFVLCSPRSGKATMADDPMVIFEVLSDSTAMTDTVAKNQEYAATPSVRRYVILAQDRIGGTMFERIGEDWIGHLLGPDTMLNMPEIDIEVPLAELYRDVTLAPDQASLPEEA